MKGLSNTGQNKGEKRLQYFDCGITELAVTTDGAEVVHAQHNALVALSIPGVAAFIVLKLQDWVSQKVEPCCFPENTVTLIKHKTDPE